MKLVRKAEGWYNLYDGEVGIGSTHEELQQPYKLSKQNCDEIFGVTDVERLADYHFSMVGNEGISSTQSFKIGFNKAMELNKDKVFTIEDIRKAYQQGEEDSYLKGGLTKTKEDNYIQSIQQPTEIEVEIVKESIGRVKLGVGSQLEQMMPKLDETGCIILKKL